MGIVKFALRFPHTFYVVAILILFLGISAIKTTPTDIFPQINIPVVSVIWQYTGLSAEDMSGRIVELEVYRRESFKKAVTAETERLVNSLPVREINIGIGRQNDLLERLRVAATKIETGVSSGLVVMLVFFAFACGMALPVWLFWDRYHEGQQNKAFCDAAGDAGIHMRIQTSESGSRFTITGPSMTGTTPKYDEHNTATGLAIDFSKPQ